MITIQFTYFHFRTQAHQSHRKWKSACC